jgi:trk system potassium uptake protein TrkA
VWAGRKLGELDVGGHARVAAVTRLGEGSVAGPDTILQDGDVIHAMVSGDSIERFDRHLGTGARPREGTDAVVIAGGGNVGTFIAEDLAKAGHEIVIVEVDADRVAEATSPRASPPGSEWITADGCEVTEFARAGVETADVVAAVTGDDEDNLVISLLAKQEFAVPRVVARVNNPKNEWMFNEMWGVDVSVSTPTCSPRSSKRPSRSGSLVRLLSFEGGRARLCEATLAPDSPANGKDLAGARPAAGLHRGGHHPRRAT